MKPWYKYSAVAGVAALALTLSACGDSNGESAEAGGVEEVRLASYLQQDTAIARAIDGWADEVEECSNGQIEFERFWNASLFDAADMRDATGAGRVEVGNFSPGYHPGEFPLTDGLLSVPFVATNVPAVMDAYKDLYDQSEEAQAEWSDQGLHLISLIPASPGALGTNVEVNTLDDLSGLDIRGYPGGGLNAGLNAVGANPVDLEMAELPEAMQRGVIDGFVGLIIDGATALSLHESTQYFTETQFGISGNAALSVNKDWWDGLSEEVQNCATEAATNLTEPYVELIDEAENQACETLESAGAVMSRLPESETEEWRNMIVDDLKAEWMESAQGLVENPEAYFGDWEAAVADAEADYPGLAFAVDRCLS